jgi:hypothetical protein
VSKFKVKSKINVFFQMEGFKLPDYEIRQIAELFIQHKTDSKNQQEKGTSITYKLVNCKNFADLG